jgi:hypothetical protein
MPTITLPDSMPRSMERLKRDSAGRPIPYFVSYVKGKPDFRVMDMEHYHEAIRRRLCWVCGQTMPGSQLRHGKVEVLGMTSHTFVAGPMCLVNMVSAEPPSHPHCAMWSARACPFLVNPEKVRREGGLPAEQVGIVGGKAIMRNPKVTGLFSVRRWWVEPVHNGQVIRFDRISAAQWLCEGRTATRAEVDESIESGLVIVREAAEAEGAGAHLDAAIARAQEWLP